MGDVSFAAAERASWRLWRLPIAREALLCSGLAGTVGSLLVWLGPPGGDLAAHEYQRTLFLLHGFTLWDNFWYAGRYAFVGYSILYYPLPALLGVWLLAGPLGWRPLQHPLLPARGSARGLAARGAHGRPFRRRFRPDPRAGVGQCRTLGRALVRTRLAWSDPRRRVSVRPRCRARVAQPRGAAVRPALDRRRVHRPDARGEPGRFRPAGSRSDRDRRHASLRASREGGACTRGLAHRGGTGARDAPVPVRDARVSRSRGAGGDGVLCRPAGSGVEARARTAPARHPDRLPARRRRRVRDPVGARS